MNKSYKYTVHLDDKTTREMETQLIRPGLFEDLVDRAFSVGIVYQKGNEVEHIPARRIFAIKHDSVKLQDEQQQDFKLWLDDDKH